MHDSILIRILILILILVVVGVDKRGRPLVPTTLPPARRRLNSLEPARLHVAPLIEGRLRSAVPIVAADEESHQGKEIRRRIRPICNGFSRNIHLSCRRFSAQFVPVCAPTSSEQSEPSTRERARKRANQHLQPMVGGGGGRRWGMAGRSGRHGQRNHPPQPYSTSRPD